MESQSLMIDGAGTHIASHNPVRNFLQIASTDPVMYSRVRPSSASCPNKNKEIIA